MSLINKMLRDLDARHSDAASPDAYGSQVRTVPERARFHRAWWIAAALGGILAALLGWELVHSPLGQPEARHSAMQEKKIAPAAADTMLASPASSKIETAPASDGKAIAQAAPEQAERKTTQAVPQPPDALAVNKSQPLPASTPVAPANADKTKHEPAPAKKKTASKAELAAKSSSPPKTSGKSPPKPDMQSLLKAAAAEKKPAPASSVKQDSVKQDDAPALPSLSKQIKEPTAEQRADNEYRKAVSSMRQGMTTAAIQGLEEALRIDARHAAARQTLIGLLLENKRQDEALRVARVGLALDASQPGLAMIAARLQVEKGELKTAIETLEKTLPHAADRADYQSFLAALLQRDGRQKEAIEHYLVALRNAPQNGVWWMGLGISFQADNRPAEAQEAFSRAKETNSLSPELLAFVEAKLRQLRR